MFRSFKGSKISPDSSPRHSSRAHSFAIYPLVEDTHVDGKQKLVGVRRSQVPDYLRESDLFLSFEECDSDSEGAWDGDGNGGGEWEVEIPSNCAGKHLKNLRTDADILQLLCALRFWVVLNPPEALLQFFLGPLFPALSRLGAWEDEVAEDLPYIPTLRRIAAARGEDRIAAAAGCGDMPLLQRLRCAGGPPTPLTAALTGAAARSGQLESLKELHAMGCPWDDRTTDGAAAGGHLECLRFARDQGCSWSCGTLNIAAKWGQLSCIQYLLRAMSTHNRPFRPSRLSYLEFLDPITCALDEAARHGHFHVVKFLDAKGPLRNSRCCTSAAAGGHLGIMKYLFLKGHSWGPPTCEAAARYGQLHVLKFLRSAQCDWDTSTAVAAALGGHLECLLFARRGGLTMSDRVAKAAASAGHVECLKYAVSKGARVGGETYCAARSAPNASGNNNNNIYVCIFMLHEYTYIYTIYNTIKPSKCIRTQ